MDIKEFRNKYPQYSDMSDQQLADSFYSKYYSDMPKEKFMQSFLGTSTNVPSRTVQKDSTVVPEWGRKNPNLYGVAGATRETLAPILEAGGLAGGAILGSSGGPVGGVAGAGLGYATARQAISSADVALGNKPDPGISGAAKQAAIDVPQGAAMEAGGQILGAGVSKAVDSLRGQSSKMYESALKPSTTLKPSVRAKRVETALKEEIPVSKGGLEKSKVTIKDINEQIGQRIKDLKGTTVSRESALQPVQDLYAEIPSKSITPQREQGIVAQYIKEVKESNPNADIPIEQAQVFKQTLNRELNEYYANLAKGKVAPEPVMARTKAAMADGLRREIVSAFPEIQGLNSREASLIELNKSIDRAVNRITNRELIPLAVQVATGRTQGLLKTIAMKAIDQPYIKSKLAIALYKSNAGKAGSIAKAGMQSGLLAFNKVLKFPDLESSAEAGTLQDYGNYVKGSTNSRQRALQEASGDSVDIPQATTALETRREPGMSTSEANAKLDRMIAEQRRNQQAQQTKKQKPFIPVKQVIVKTTNGEELMYQDKTGKLYADDPNE